MDHRTRCRITSGNISGSTEVANHQTSTDRRGHKRVRLLVSHIQREWHVDSPSQHEKNNSQKAIFPVQRAIHNTGNDSY